MELNNIRDPNTATYSDIISATEKIYGKTTIGEDPILENQERFALMKMVTVGTVEKQTFPVDPVTGKYFKYPKLRWDLRNTYTYA